MTLEGFLIEKTNNKDIDVNTKAFVKHLVDGKEEALTFAKVGQIQSSGANYLKHELSTVKRDEKDGEILVFVVK